VSYKWSVTVAAGEVVVEDGVPVSGPPRFLAKIARQLLKGTVDATPTGPTLSVATDPDMAIAALVCQFDADPDFSDNAPNFPALISVPDGAVA
jgi:hypothetical protein